MFFSPRNRHVFFLLLALSTLSACRSSDPLGFLGFKTEPAATKAACAAGALCAGAAKRTVTPTQAHIDGVTEMRFMALPRTQRFNLGGFGVNPTQNLPDPVGPSAEALTQPAEQRVYTNREGREEDLWLRVLVLEGPDSTGATQRVAFIALDAIGAGNIVQEKVAAAVSEVSCAMDACIAAADVLFGQTHTHAGPDLQGLWGGVPQDWIETRLLTGVREAVGEALANLKGAELSVAQTTLPDFNNYRRPRVDPLASTSPFR